MQNSPLLVAVGESGLPVLLKRGPAATMDEFLLAAEYILKTGNTQVMLCERGIRTFEDHTRFTLPLASVPYLHQTTHLPVVVDPSHGTGKASLVATMARAAVASGADGLIVEVHPNPEKALSDGFQALTPAAFCQMMADCRKVAGALGIRMGVRSRWRLQPPVASRASDNGAGTSDLTPTNGAKSSIPPTKRGREPSSLPSPLC
jgi:3-deoxy-7-phosphoheptulonate synthase